MGIVDSWLDFRDRCLKSPRFHRWAKQFPLTRPLVRKRQIELFDLVSGFVYSQILLACVELDILQKVGSGISCKALAQDTGLGIDETRRLAEGAASLRLLQKRKGIFRLGDLGAALIANPGVMEMVRHHPLLYRDLADPVAFLRAGRGETRLSKYWTYDTSRDQRAVDTAQVQAYSELMSASLQMVADEIMSAVDFSDHKILLDVGGGQGTFVRAVAAQHADLQFQIFDLPAVADRAREALANSGIADRSQVFSGSFFEDELPKGADVVSLVRIIHDHDDGPASQILKAVYETLPGGGRLIVCEPMSTQGYASRVGDAYFNFYLYALGSGRPRSSKAIRDLLASVGFEQIRTLPTRSSLIGNVVSAHRPSKEV